MHMIGVQSYESLHGFATIHKTSKMTYIVGGTLYLQSMTFFITCCSCLELYCLLGNFLLDSCLEAFSWNLSSFFKLVHTILSCSLSVYHIFILSFSLLSFCSPSLPSPCPPPPPLSASTQPTTHTEYFYTVLFAAQYECCGVTSFCHLMIKYAGSIFFQNNGDLSTRLYCEKLKEFLSSGFSLYTLQCFSGVISLQMSVVFHPCLYSVC